MATLNLGILAHVDAGKTTLTERLLHAAGVIDEIGRVDDGTTQTDSLALERQRGITIKSAVVSFVVDGVTINLIDTPGHPDFIAEVERVLGVLDGAVLVVSAVEGVQSQTLLLFRALRRLGVPTIVFVNKIDRVGADDRRVLDAIAERLAANVLAMGTPRGVGTKRAGVTVHDLDDPTFADGRHRGAGRQRRHDPAPLPRRDADRARPSCDEALAEQTARLHVLPVYFGAALTGVGVDDLLHAIPRLLPAVDGDRDGPGVGNGVQDRARAERREDRLRAHVLRDAADARSRPARRRRSTPTRSPPSRSSIGGTTQRRPATHGGRDRQGPRARRRHASATRSARPPTPVDRARLRPADAGDGDRAAAPRPEAGRVRRARPSSPSRIRSSTSARTTPARSCSCRSTARCRRRSSPRRCAATTASTSSSDRRRRSASSDRTASARPSNCSAAAGRRATRSSPRSAWRSRRCRPARA